MFACTKKVAAALASRTSMNIVSRSMAEKAALPSLPYGYKDLEPVISGEIMELHHSKHHATYVTNYNAALDKLQEATSKNDTNTILQLGPALKFNGGGHINHSIFWTVLSKNGGQPSAELLEAIKRDFGSLDNLKTQLQTISTNVQGSGWGWLGLNSQSKKLQLATCANQDPLQATTGLVPLFGIDVWEHAYYLQYKNVRASYTKAILDIINWNEVSRRYKAALN